MKNKLKVHVQTYFFIKTINEIDMFEVRKWKSIYVLASYPKKEKSLFVKTYFHLLEIKSP
jgi:hypothetical protein